MPRPIRIRHLDGGLNQFNEAAQIEKEQAAYAQNFLFTRGVFKTPYGFAQLGSDQPSDSENVLSIHQYSEQDGTDSVLAVTDTDIQRYDPITQTWSSRKAAGSIQSSSIENPISWVAVPHTDGIALDGTGADAYYHLLMCDGGLSPIQRWAGVDEDNFFPLAGADGYHETDSSPTTPTAHYAQQVSIFYNHVILLNPKQWDATADVFLDKKQTVLYGKAGLLEGSNAFHIAEIGAGYNDLVDTGGQNLWSTRVGSQLTIYQDNSIWAANHVGGSDIFRFKPQIEKLGLLAPHLVVSLRNVDYFIGNDYNLYQYFGGSQKQPFGDKIQPELEQLMDPSRTVRCWMSVGARARRLWIFYVETGNSFALGAYGIDMKTGAWMHRDYTHAFGSGVGITAVAMTGTAINIVGATYAQAIATGETYTEALVGSPTYAEEVFLEQIEASMALGSSDGTVYQYDADLTTDNGEDVPCTWHSKIFDFGTDEEVWASEFSLTLKGTGTATISFRIEGFGDEDSDWIDFSSVTLTDDYQAHRFCPDGVTSPRIQIKVYTSGSVLSAKAAQIQPPVIIGEWS